MAQNDPLPDVALADEPAAFEVTRSDTVWRSRRVVDVRTDRVVMPDGSTVVRDVVVHPGAVGIVAVDEHRRVLLIRQYRHPVGRRLWEPPAGLLDEPGEDPLVAARRELFEEAHLRAGRWDLLLDAYTSPGMTSEAVRIYLAREVTAADGPRFEAHGEEADLITRWVPLAAAVDAVLGGALHNPLTVMGLLAADRLLAAGVPEPRPADTPWPEMSSFPGSAIASGS